MKIDPETEISKIIDANQQIISAYLKTLARMDFGVR